MPKKIPLKVQKRSGFNKSFQNILTSKPGTITPLLCDELIPNTKVNLRATIQASLPPLAFDTFMRCSLKVQAFFVPMRILVGSFEDFFTQQQRESNGNWYTPTLPSFSVNFSNPLDPSINWPVGPGSLMDYLGYKLSPNGSAPAGTANYSMMPLLAYHRIYNDWFRNTRIQREIYTYDDYNSPTDSAGVSYLPFSYVNDENATDVYTIDSSVDVTDSVNSPQFFFADGHNVFDLRQCNFEDDYFTIATQNASDQDIKITTSGNEFSIGSLRGGNALQIYADRHNIAGPRYIDRLRSDYNAHLSEGIAQRCICLGSQEFEVYSKGIYQQSNAETTAQLNNPFNSTGARFGDAYAAGNGMLADFTAEEPGYLFVVCELVPRVTYGSGIDRKFRRYCGVGSITDMANPILQGVGNQPIFRDELNTKQGQTQVFGYTERYADWKTKCDETHGIVKEGESLGAMVLQRNFIGTGTLEISDSFIQVPTNYMDNVTAVTNTVSTYGYWLDSFFDYKVSMPLAQYSIPTLEDVANEHQTTVEVRPGGQRMP